MGVSTRTDDERSLPQLISEMTSEISELVRKELELAKVETKAEINNAARAGGLFGGAAFAASLALLLLSFALAWGLAEAIAPGAAFLMVGVLYAAVAAVMFLVARDRAEEINPVPEQTVETLKEDVAWARARRS
jgi:hypothetical protein